MKKITMLKSTWKMVDGARSKDDMRHILNGIFFTPGGELVATDGKMLVKLAADQVYNVPETGVYEIMKVEKADSGLKQYVDIYLNIMDGQYPDIDRVIPEPGRHDEQLHISVPDSIKKSAMSATRCVIQAYQHTGNAYNVEMFVILGTHSDEWFMYKAGNNKPCRMEASGAVAVIMPFSI